MPVLNGLDASRALKKLMPSVPIILFTLNVYPFLEVEAQAASIAAVRSYRQPVVFSTAAQLDPPAAGTK